MLINKGDQFVISDFSQIQEVQLFLRQKSNNLRLEELHSLYVYLQILYGLKHFSLPLHILKWESPDFVLNEKIGIEVVKSATQSEEHAFSIMEKEYPEGSLLEVPFYVPGSKAEVREGIRGPDEPLQSSGFGDYGKEKVWLDCVCQRLNEKTFKLNRNHFLKYQSNQLIIYDDTCYFPKVDYVIPKLQRDYKSSTEINFNHVHIIMNVMRFFVVDVFGQCSHFNIPSEVT